MNASVHTHAKLTYAFAEIRTGNVAPTRLTETLVSIVLERILSKVEQVVISPVYNGSQKSDESENFADCAHGLEWQRLTANERTGQPIHPKKLPVFGSCYNVSMPG
jgi:hypothetical protein